MSATSYEIPAEMRDFAAKSVDQARKAFEGFMGAAQKAAGSMEQSGLPVAPAVKGVSEKAMHFAQSNVNAAFDLAHKMVAAKDVNEVMALQTAYLKSQMEAIQAQAKEMGAAIQQSVAPKA